MARARSLTRRRDAGQEAPNLVSSASRVKLSSRGAGTGIPRKEEWQTEAFAFRRDVPEIGFATRFVGSALSQVRLYVGYRPDKADPNDPPLAVDAKSSIVPQAVQDIAIAELKRLSSGTPSLSAFMRKFAVNIDLVGEAYLVGIAATAEKPEQWSIRSRSEVDVATDEQVTVKSSPADKGIVLRDGVDTCIRLFLSDEEWTDRASSPMEYLLTDCRILQTLTQQIYAESTSRLSAGMLLVPNELGGMPTDATGDEDGQEDQVMVALMETLTAPVEDPSNAASIVPAVFRGPQEAIAAVRHLFLGRPVDEKLEERLNGRVNRLARGLDLPVEVVMGHASTTFSNAAQIDKDTFEDHLEPRCVTLVELLTVGFLSPNLHDNPTVPEEWKDRIEVWFDPSALLPAPNPEENANDGHEKLILSDAAWRREKGFSEDDAPTAEELIRRIVQRKGVFTGDITVAMLRFLAFGETIADLQLPLFRDAAVAPPGELPTVAPQDTLPATAQDTPPPPVPTPTPPPPPAAVPVAPGPPQGGQGDVQASATLSHVVDRLLDQIDRQQQVQGSTWTTLSAAIPVPVPTPGVVVRRSRTLGSRLTEMDRDLRLRMVVATSASVERALERAGNRLKAKAGRIRDQLKAVPPRECAAYLTAAVVADAGFTADQLLDGVFDSLEQLVRGWAGGVQSSGLELVHTAVHGIHGAHRTVLQERQAADLDAGWVYLKQELTRFAEQRMWDPNPEVPPGEYDPTAIVPPGLVRRAMARMGGRADAVTAVTAGAWTPVPGAGVATGDLLLDTFASSGGGIDGYAWVYGPGHRRTSFMPHQELDGVEFINFDDAVLANDAGWPETPFFFPGDHDGCLCDAEPITIDPETAAELGYDVPPSVDPNLLDETVAEDLDVEGADADQTIAAVMAGRDAVMDGLDADTRATLSAFASQNDALNALRRGGETTDVLRDVMNMAETHTFDKPITVYRGVSQQVADQLLTGLNAGDKLTMPGAAYSTAWKDYAVLYGADTAGTSSTVFEIVTDTGLPMPTGFATGMDEMAVVLSGTKDYTVVSVRVEEIEKQFSSKTLTTTIIRVVAR